MKKILVVDDDNELLQLVQLSLEAKGYKVKSICNGKDTLQAIKDFSPDIILLDVYLGENNGIDICKELKENPSTKDIKIIIFSTQATILNQCHATAFIRKPFYIEQLYSLIEKN